MVRAPLDAVVRRAIISWGPSQVNAGCYADFDMRPMGLPLVAAGSALVSYGCIGLFCIACDGHLGVEGYVYRALPSEPSTVAVKAETAPRHSREPLAGCVVTLEPWAPGNQPRSADTARLWTKQAVTDSSGHFMAGGTAQPGHYDVTVSVACPTAGKVQRVFRHDRQQTHDVTVVMGAAS
jgi:hypothetical protein